MFPFLVGFVWQLNRLVSYSIPTPYKIWTIILVIVDTVFLSQFALVTPEIPLVFCFLWAVNAALFEKRFSLSFAILLLGLISMRGLIAAGVILLFDCINTFFLEKNKPLKLSSILNHLLPYLPFFITFIGFLFYHYHSQGWIIHNTVSNRWDSADEWNSLYGIFRNAGILSWRILDSGRIVLIIILFIIYIKRKFWMSKIYLQKKEGIQLLFLLVLSIGLYLPILLFYQNALAQRYLMPFYLCLTLFVVYMITHFIRKERVKKALLGLSIFVMLTGHFWVYPARIAQSWASITAHIPYHNLRHEMLQYIDQKEIPLQYIGTSFPNIGKLKYLDCSDRTTGFVEKDLATQDYIFYANIYNDFTDQELADLKTDWVEEKRLQKGQVYVILYKKKD